MKRPLIAGLAVLMIVSGVAATASAQAPAEVDLISRDAALFVKFDDGDRALSKDEIGGYPWLRYDTDADGVVDKAEFLLGRAQDRRNAKLAPSTAESFALLDWTNDGKLSGAELDGELWLSFDADGDKTVTKAEYLGVNPAVPGPASQPGTAELGWKSLKVKFMEFEVPGTPTLVKDTPDLTEYRLNFDGIKASFIVVVRNLNKEVADPDAMLEQVSKETASKLKGQIVADEKITLSGFPGRDLMMAILPDTRFRQQMFVARSHYIQALVVAKADSSVKPADVERFFASLKIASADVPTPDAPNGGAGGDTLETARSAQAKFIAAVAAGDERAAHALFHPLVRAQINPAFMQVHFDIMKSQMGAVTDTKVAPEFTEETIDGIHYRHAKQRLQCVNGSLDVKTSFAKGVVAAFQLDAPQLEPELVNRLVYKYLMDLGQESKDFSGSFVPECEKFVRTLCDSGAKEAIGLLDPRVQEQLVNKGGVERLEHTRSTLGSVKSLELVTFRIEGTPEKGLAKFIIGLEAKRPGKAPATCEFIFETEGLQTLIVGYSFEQPLTKDDVPPPPKTPSPSTDDDPPSPPHIAPPRTSLPPPPKTSNGF